MDKFNIEIDGKTIEADPGSMLIEAADNNGIHIPRFCYHKKLSVAANCRMCLVEVEKAPKPLPACATPVTAGMIVRTRSKKALEAQRAVMEFLLINHPLDCPICDQGGECELQDVAMGYGKDLSRYTEGKRTVKDKNIGPLISTEMTRCIQCTRCVRFGEEVAGFREMGGMNRGEHLEIGTYLDHNLQSEVSGNIIDLCPVGALTSKPFRFKARAWELQQRPSIAPHDALGSNINVHLRRGEVMRVVPRDNESINETWLSDRDRFAYTGLNSDDRLMQPMIKRKGVWETVDWSLALEQAAIGLKEIINLEGADELAALASTQSTLEELYLLQKIMRCLGSPHVDHRVRQIDFSCQDAMPLFPGLYQSIEQIEHADQILILGSNIHHDMPLLALRIRKAQVHGAKVHAINPLPFTYHFDVQHDCVCDPQDMIILLMGIAAALNISLGVEASISDTAKAIATDLQSGKRVTILLGVLVEHHPQSSLIRHLAKLIADQCLGQVGLLTEGPNAAGAWLAGMVPHRQAAGKKANKMGQDAAQLCETPKKGYVLFNLEPLDIGQTNVMQTLKAAKFVIALTSFKQADLLDVADVILPIAPFTETVGTFVNLTGLWQSFTAVSKPFGEVRPGWKVLRVLGNLLELPGFDYEDAFAIRDELKAQVDAFTPDAPAPLPAITKPSAQEGLVRVGHWPIYRGDPLVRRAQPLQDSGLNGSVAAFVHPALAVRLKLTVGQHVIVQQSHAHIQLPLQVDERLPMNVVYIPAGYSETAILADYAAVILGAAT